MSHIVSRRREPVYISRCHYTVVNILQFHGANAMSLFHIHFHIYTIQAFHICNQPPMYCIHTKIVSIVHRHTHTELSPILFRATWIQNVMRVVQHKLPYIRPDMKYYFHAQHTIYCKLRSNSCAMHIAQTFVLQPPEKHIYVNSTSITRVAYMYRRVHW